MVTIILMSLIASAKIEVAVLDTGINPNVEVRKCVEPVNFTSTNSTTDEYGHGSNISAVIEKKTEEIDVCQHILKVFNTTNPSNSIRATVKALNYVLSHPQIQIVNYSGGGYQYSLEEKQLIKKLLDRGVKVFAAAGNEGFNLDLNCNYFPACYDSRIVVVGSLDIFKKKSSFSNYGKVVDVWITGEGVQGGGLTLNGTSQATARATNKYIRSLSRNPSNVNDQALNKTTEALGKSIGLDRYLSKVTEDLKEMVPVSMQPYIPFVTFTAKTISNQKVEIKYEF